MNNYKEEIDKIEKEVNERSLEQARLQERLQTLEEEKEKIEYELKQEGFTIEKLEETIHSLEIEIQEELEKCKELLK